MDEGSPTLSKSKVNGHLGIDNPFNQVNSEPGDKRVDGTNGNAQDDRAQMQDKGDDLVLNLNLNSNSNLSPDVGHVWDCHNQAIKTTVLVGDNRDECADGLNVVITETALEAAPINDAEDKGLSPIIHTSSSSSSSKTKTAPLSSNGYSKELVLLNQLSQDKGRLSRDSGLEDEVNQGNSCSVQLTKDASIPPGFCVEKDLAPPGFERPVAASVNGGGKELLNERQRTPAESRVTRSQLKKTMAQESRKQRTSANRKQRTVASVETTDSMKQLAEEALKVGELLGVKVISHKANAIKRITDSLKANNGACSTRNRR